MEISRIYLLFVQSLAIYVIMYNIESLYCILLNKKTSFIYVGNSLPFTPINHFTFCVLRGAFLMCVCQPMFARLRSLGFVCQAAFVSLSTAAAAITKLLFIIKHLLFRSPAVVLQ